MVRVLGSMELAAEFKEMGVVSGRSLEPAWQAGAELIVTTAERLAPKASGELADNIGQETQKRTRRAISVAVGPDDEIFYALFLEFGVSSHEVVRQQAQGLEVAQGEFRASSEHPGVAAKPFLRPAFDEKLDAVVETIADELFAAMGLT